MAKMVNSEVFLRWLTANGIIPERAFAVTIRARVGSVLAIEVEMRGDENLMTDDAKTVFEGAKVEISKPDDILRVVELVIDNPSTHPLP